MYASARTYMSDDTLVGGITSGGHTILPTMTPPGRAVDDLQNEMRPTRHLSLCTML